VLLYSDPRGVAAAAAGADLLFVAAAILLVFADRALMAFRWIALLCIVDRATLPPFPRLMETFFVSTFLGTFLPASVGGDAVRAFSLSRDGVGTADAVASVFMDRMLGVASLLVMGVSGMLLARSQAAHPAVLLGLAVTAAACAVTIAAIFSRPLDAWIARALRLIPIRQVQTLGGKLLASVQEYARFQGRLLGVLAASIAVQVLRVVQAYCLGRSLGLESGPSLYFAYVPLILLVMLLPVTFNGLGTSQAAFVWFFTSAGEAAAPAFTLSVLFVALGVVGNLPGGLLYAFGGTRAARAAVPRSHAR
jgi:uncharacterized protein (TIRG00374 family)